MLFIEKKRKAGHFKQIRPRGPSGQRFGTDNTEELSESDLTMRSSLVDFAGLEGRERVRKAERKSGTVVGRWQKQFAFSAGLRGIAKSY